MKLPLPGPDEPGSWRSSPLQKNTPGGNYYHLPTGEVVYAESPLYTPQVETDDPGTHYSDFPKQNED